MNDLVYTIKLDSKGNLSAATEALQQSLDKVQGKARKASGMMRQMMDISKKLDTMRLDSLVNNVRNVVDSLSSIGSVGSGFEQSLADLSSITGLIGKDLDTIAKAARDTGRESGLGAKGAVDAFALLASQIQIDKIGMQGLMQLQKETITLSHASNMSMADAATAMAATINQFGLGAGEANRVINVLAAGSKYGASEIMDLAQSFKVTGSVAASAGLTIEQTAGALEVLSQSNLKGAEAGTALRNIIVKLQTQLGVDLSKTGLGAALSDLQPRLQDVTYLAKLFGAENLAAAQYLITNANAVNEMTAAVTGTNVAQEQAAIRTNTVAEKMKVMQASADELKIKLFDMTGGLIGYSSVIGEQAFALAQLAPAFSMVKGAVTGTFGGFAKLYSAIKIANTQLVLGAKSGNLFITALTGMLAGLSSLSTIVGKGTNLLADFSTILIYNRNALKSIPGSIMKFVSALSLQNVAAKAATVSMAALNVVMSANPVIFIGAAIVALIGSLVVLYNKCELVRKAVNWLWLSFKSGAAIMWSMFVLPFKEALNYVVKIISGIGKLLGFKSKGKIEVLPKVEGEVGSKGDNKVVPKTDTKEIETISKLTKKIEELKKLQNDASLEHAIAIEKEIQLYQNKLDLMKKQISASVEQQGRMDTIAGLTERINKLRADQENASLGQAINLEKEIALYQEKLDLIKKQIVAGTMGNIAKPKYTEELKAPEIKPFSVPPIMIPLKIDERSIARVNERIAKESSDIIREMEITAEQIKGIVAGSVQSLAQGLGEAIASGSGLEVMKSLLITVMDMLQQFGSALIAAGVAAASFKSLFANPIAGIIAGSALIAATAVAKAALQNATAFAAGGIVSGPTLALVGEYSGASNNPEVIAPLDKLRSLIEPARPSFEGLYLETKVRGKDLYVALQSVERTNNRTR